MNVRAISFFLPQFHPVPENDEWWEKGFTEWTNVSKCSPRFSGHYQPHLPSDLGFYDLRVPEVREIQAEYAKKAGIEGFCYYHYWFNGRRILERPVNDMLKSGKPEFPFCLCWANENWSRRWDGSENDLLLEQKHSDEDDRNHIKSLLEAFRDSRYIRVNGKPLFLVYRTDLLPNPARTAEIWREEAINSGVGELYLVRVESFGNYTPPESIGFDASVEFPPHNTNAPRLMNNPLSQALSKANIFTKPFVDNRVYDYSQVIQSYLRRKLPDYKLFRCVTPSWDNSARKKSGALIYHQSTPDKYGYWLSRVVLETSGNMCDPSEKIVFINAWNEWAEGNHLEPDRKWGNQYIESTRIALNSPDFFIEKSLDCNPCWPYQPIKKIRHELDRHLLWRFKQ